MFLERHGIDLGAGEEREQDGADSREQRRVVGLLDVLANSWDVAGDGAHEYLDERN